MMKRLFTLLFVLAFGLTFPQLGQARNWTFMVYMDADNDLEGAGIDDFLEMASVGSDSNVAIVVQFDRISGYDNRYQGWEIAHRFYITSGMTPIPTNAISNWGDGTGGREVNMGDPQTLEDFVLWAMNNYPAENYALILWDHGGGWRETEATQLRKPKFKAVCWDETSGGDALYMNEVQSALATIQNQTGKKINLLGFDACLMGMAEVAYEIKDDADVMVASEETIPYNGWPYNTILGDLVYLPTMSVKDFGSVIVNRYGESYGNNSGTTLSAVELMNMDNLIAFISNFATSLQSETYRRLIRRTRSRTQEYYYPEHIDLYHFADLIYRRIPDANIQDAAYSVLSALENVIFSEFHGTPLRRSYGLAVYFPERKGEFDNDYNCMVIDFPCDTYWDEFLNWYYTP